MKKFFAIAVAAVFMFAGVQVMASPPVPGPVEGFTIKTTTQIECLGAVQETESYSWVYGFGEGPIGPMFGDGAEVNRAAENQYRQSFKAVDGYTTFIKDFSADSDSIPNLAVDTLIGYTANPSANAAQAQFSERIGLSVVAAGDELSQTLTGLLSLCPWVAGSSTVYPATNEGVAAGSSFTVTNIRNFNSNGSVTTTGIPELKYNVVAADPVGGSAGGWGGQGVIQAGFVVSLWEANDVWDGNGVPPLASRTEYTEFATADGVWNFQKSVEYKSVFPELGRYLFPFDQVLP